MIENIPVLPGLSPVAGKDVVVRFDTLRLKLVKIAARVIEMKTRIKVQLPSTAPCQEILSFILGRLPRLVT